MKHVLAGGALVALILSASLASALQTSSMDDLQVALQARFNALGDTKEEAKVKKGLGKLLGYFDAPSDSTKTDAKLISKIAKGVEKLYEEDLAILDEAIGDMDGFLDELQVILDAQQLAVNAMADEYKGKAKAQAGVEAAQVAIDSARAIAPVLKLANGPGTKGKLVGKAEKAVAKGVKNLLKAVKKGGLVGHAKTFALDKAYTDATSCATAGCHDGYDLDVMATGHWNWQGASANIEGYEAGTHGKTDLINNFCIAIDSNEGRCTQCHIGYDWTDTATYDFADETKIDCLVCHDTTGTYKKALFPGGVPDVGVNLDWVAMNVGKSSRSNCGACHFFAGGGDNVKHGDLASTLGAAPTAVDDVHMGTDGENMTCAQCHVQTDHGIAGMGLHSLDEGTVTCQTAGCHDEGTVHTSNSTIERHLDAIACQTCHIPTFSRSMPTKMEWYWETAGNLTRVPGTDQWGKPDYDKKKGDFVWNQDVTPELMWFNGKWNRKIIGVNDAHGGTPTVNDPVDLGSPVGQRSDMNSKIYPFKKMIGTQPADAGNFTMLVPHLWGTIGGATPYWGNWLWHDALVEGASKAGQTYTGAYNFVDTVMYLSLNHEIVSGSDALNCGDCHGGARDWSGLGYTGDPNSDAR